MTVDVMQSFNFGRDYVLARRHQLSDLSLTRGMKVAFYSKSGKIESGVLCELKVKQQAEQKQKQGGKGKTVVIDK
jgi:hypothetical protein